MSFPYNIGIFGGDLRQVYMATAFLARGYNVATCGISTDMMPPSYSCESFCLCSCTAASLNTKDPLPIGYNPPCYRSFDSLKELFDQSAILIGPIPMSRDKQMIFAKNPPTDFLVSNIMNLLKDNHVLIGGDIPTSIVKHCNSRNIPYYDLMGDEEIAILNAIATAEGTIMEAIKNSTRNLHGSNSLVLGYGRCGRILAQKLKALDSSVTVAARSKEALAYAQASGCNTISLCEMDQQLSHYPFIFNTIPAPVLQRTQLDKIDQKAVLIDIASFPGGIDFDYAETLHLNAQLHLGLPGKYAPETSSDILVNAVLTYIKERSD